MALVAEYGKLLKLYAVTFKETLKNEINI